MTQSTVQTLPARSGDARVSDETRVGRATRQRSARTARRRWLVLFAVVIVVVVGILANIKPLTHYQDASDRLEKTTATVETLKSQKTQLQSNLAKLSETGYLETLAREQLTYARPGEDLYIVTGAGTAGGDTQTLVTSAAGPSIGAGIASALDGHGGTASTGASAEGQETATDAAGSTQPEDQRGFFERIISSIRGLF